ncbi:ABC-2 family transporter protein [Mobilitalea sibirica]|uniref:ABC-2 family transporter protein n=1 Tax=Mobilitalea sibirica TaxID=1462919 RepID=A0A8J7HBY2_9FIRM|nr:ABC-2 family transporter protein [Mobilitalea sibirica]MBH1941606.1 ABC-2 family transporter protein [Mobilitalea sibirica]
MKKFLKLFSLFLWDSKLKLSRAMEYRFDFVLGTIVNLIFSCVGPIMQYLIFTQTKGFPGWNLNQIILFQGILLFVLALKSILWGEVPGYIVSLVRRGDLDRLLLKPFPSIGIILSSGFSANNFGTLISSIFLITYSLFILDLDPRFFDVIMLLVYIFLGLLLFMAMNIILASAIIILINMGRLNEIMESLSRFGQYPLEIYSNTLRAVFVGIVPFAIWVNYPSRILLYGFQGSMLYSVIFCTVFLAGSLCLWSTCLKRYTSGGG